MSTNDAPMAGLDDAPGSGPTAADSLLAQLALLPDGLALTAVGQKKAAYLPNWQKQGLSRERLVAEINAGRAIAIGLICGPLSGGVLIVDHDGASAGPLLQELMGDESLPPTWIWSSGRTGRWAAAYRVPEQYWPRMAGIWEKRTGIASPDDGKAEGLELRWDQHYSVVVGAHPQTSGYHWFRDRSPADLQIAEAPLPLILPLIEAALLKKQRKPDPLPLLEQPTPAASGLRLPLLEFVSRETRAFVESGGTPGHWNDDQLRHAQDLIGTERWLIQQGHQSEPSARNAFADHIAAAIQKDASFDKRRAWLRFDGGLKLDPAPSTPVAKLESRLAHHIRSATCSSDAHPRLQSPTASNQTAAPPRDQKAEEVRLPASYSEAIARCLSAIRRGDVDEEMSWKADLKTRFRVNDEQISVSLFKQHGKEQIKYKNRTHDSIRLSDVAPLTYLLDGWAPKGDIALTYGPFGTGKTTLAMAKLYAHATGANLLDRENTSPPGRGLFIATDSGAAALKKSMIDLGIDVDTDPILTPGHPDQRIWVWAQEPDQGHKSWICDIHGVVTLEKFIREKEITYVIIDSAKAVSTPAGWDYISNQSVKTLILYLREGLAQPTGTCIEFLSHDGTEKGSHSGAKAWAEDPSMVCALSIAKEGDKRIGVTANFRKDRAASIDPNRSVTFSLANGQLVLKAGVEVVGNCADALLSILWEAHQRGVESLSKRELSDAAFSRYKRTHKTVENTLGRIAGTGKGRNPTPVIRLSRGRYALSPAEIQKREGDTNKPLSFMGDNTGRMTAPQSICPPPNDSPEGERQELPVASQSPQGESIGVPEIPVTACDLVEIHPKGREHPIAAEGRIPCLVKGEPGWSRKAGLMRGLSVFVSHADGRQLAAGRDEITDLDAAC